MTEAGTIQADDVLSGLSIVDGDAHFTEPPDLWVSRAPASMQDRMPHMRTEGGVSLWYLDGTPLMRIGGNTLGHGNEKQPGILMFQSFDEIAESSWSVKSRLQLLDEMGIYAQVLFPNAIGFSSNTFFKIEDLGQRELIARIYNDFLCDVQEESRGRLFPQAVLPVWDMDLTLKEMSRLRDKGITGFTLSDKPHLLGLPELDDPYFEPMWALSNEMGAVLSFHIAGGTQGIRGNQQNFETKDPMDATNPDEYFSSFGPQRRGAIRGTQMFMSNVRLIINLTMSDLFDRYPNLKIFSAESGIGYIPFLLESIEYQLDEMVTTPAEIALQQRRPTDYFRDHIYVSFWFEKIGPTQLLDEIGVDNVLIETDVPHPTCLHPRGRERLAEVMADFDPETRRRICQDNAAELFGLSLPSVT